MTFLVSSLGAPELAGSTTNIVENCSLTHWGLNLFGWKVDVGTGQISELFALASAC